MEQANHRELAGAVAALALAALPPAAWAEYVEAAISSDNVQIAAQQYRFKGFDLSVLYTEQHDHQDLLAGAGYLAKTWLLGKRQNFYISTGAKFFTTDVTDFRVNALAWRNLLRYEPSAWPQLQFAAELDYAPSFTTFADGESLWLAVIQGEYGLSEGRDLLLGWRRVRTQIDDSDSIDVERGGYLGLRQYF